MTPKEALQAFVNLAETRLQELGCLSPEMQKCLDDGKEALNPTPQPLKPKDVPLWGVRNPNPKDCRIETDRECGCAFGKCQNGLIF